MLFNSPPFLFLFLPITMLGYHLLGRYGRRPVIAWLAAASVFFYAVWNPVFVFFLLGSIVVNYLVARAHQPGSRGLHATPALCSTSASRSTCSRFSITSTSSRRCCSSHASRATCIPHPILLPLGISFFTFTQISYLVDLAQGQAERQDFLSYLLFVTFFPHLIAGPILHHKEMMPQFGKPLPRSTNLDQALTPVPPSAASP